MQALFPSTQEDDGATETSVYGNVDYQLNDQWNVGLGLRYSNVNTTRGGDPLEIDEDVTSVRLTVDYLPNEDTLVYVTTTTGVSSGFEQRNTSNGSA